GVGVARVDARQQLGDLTAGQSGSEELLVEPYSVDGTLVEDTLSGRGAVRSKQSLLFVVAQRAHTDAGQLGYLTDPHPHGRANQHDGAAIPCVGTRTRVVGSGWSPRPWSRSGILGGRGLRIEPLGPFTQPRPPLPGDLIAVDLQRSSLEAVQPGADYLGRVCQRPAFLLGPSGHPRVH